MSEHEQRRLAFDVNKARARNTDPETSHEAAESITSDKIRESQAVVLGLLRRFGPMTDTEIWTAYEASRNPAAPTQSPSGLRTRRCELIKLMMVYDTGKRRVLASGRNSIVWAAT